MTKSRNILRPRQAWSEADLQLLRQRYPDTQTVELARMIGRPIEHVYKKAGQLGLSKSEAFKASELSGRMKPGSMIGLATRLKPGGTSWNKGKPFPSRGRSAETTFKPGQRGTRWVPIGSERVNKYGYLVRKVAETGRYDKDWKFVHRLNWEAAHGPVPKGHLVAFNDGNKSNTDVGNLVLRTKAEHIAIHTIANYPPALRSAVHLVAKIRRKVNEQSDDR